MVGAGGSQIKTKLSPQLGLAKLELELRLSKNSNNNNNINNNIKNNSSLRECQLNFY